MHVWITIERDTNMAGNRGRVNVICSRLPFRIQAVHRGAVMQEDFAVRNPVALPASASVQRATARPIVIGIVNNMPDAALEGVESQFSDLLQAASGSRSMLLRFSSLPEIPRGPAASRHVSSSYWHISDLMGSPLDALIVTGTEPRSASLRDEPYW